ncbi:MAG: outer membrane lipoprotein carrier protein LolA [Blastomonas sp.]
MKTILRPALAIGTAAALVGAGLAGLAGPLVASAQAQADSSANDLSQISRHLRALTSLRANFVQTDRSGQMLTGKLIMKQPGRIRFEYQKDAKLLIVSDGSALTMIDYEVNQVQRWPIRNSPLGVLVDPKRDLSKYGKIVRTSDPNVVSVEVKDPKRPEYGVITLIFQRSASAPAGLEMIGWVALDSQNKRTSIRLSGQRYNVAVSNTEFKWTDPRGGPGPRR